MITLSQIKQFLINYFWPFFNKNIWPVIKDTVVAIVQITLKHFLKRYEEILDERSRKRQEEAKRKAQEAEEKAATASDEAEVENYRAIAEVWREVAEEHRRENELLKEELAAVSRKLTQAIEQNLQSMQLKAENDKVHLKSGDKIIPLPAPSDGLPTPPDEE